MPPLGALCRRPRRTPGRGPSDAEAGAQGRARAPSLLALPLQPDLCPRSFHPQFRNPKASLRVRLCDLLGHLQRSGERDCQEFYRALYIHAQPLHSRLPSRLALRKCAPRAPRQEQAVGCGRCRISRACCYTGGGVWRVWLRPPSSLVPWGPSPAGWGPLSAVPALGICAPVAETVVVRTAEGALAGGGGDPRNVGISVERCQARWPV